MFLWMSEVRLCRPSGNHSKATGTQKSVTRESKKNSFLLSRLIYFTPTRMPLIALWAPSQGSGGRVVQLRGAERISGDNLWRKL